MEGWLSFWHVPGPWRRRNLATVGMNISKGLGQSTKGFPSNVDRGKFSIEKIRDVDRHGQDKMAELRCGFRLQLSDFFKDLPTGENSAKKSRST
jgi:hypothetical protein